MKSLPRILFVLFAIGLIGFAIYNIQNNKSTIIEEEKRSSDVEPQVLFDLRLGIAEFDIMNPILSKNRNVQDIAKIIYEPLVNLNSEYKAEPCLATEWSKADDNSYIIKLREGVKWHDGSNFTAKDVKFTIDKIKSPEVPSIYKFNLSNVAKLDIIDNYTIKLSLDADVPFFEYNLTFPILSENYYVGQDFLATSKNRNPVGTGRFKVYAEEDGSLTLNRFKDYWGEKNKENPQGLKTIHVYMFGSMGEMYNSFKIGNLDLITTNNLYAENYIGTLGYNKKEFKGKEFDYIAFNTENRVLAYPEVRRAISMIIDKGTIMARLYNSKYYYAEFPLDYQNWIYNNDTFKLTYNPEEAERILIENGWEYKYSAWRKVEKYTTLRTNLTLTVNSANELRVAAAEIIKDELSSKGINITIRKVSDSEYYNCLANRNYDMILMGTSIGLSPNINTYMGNGNYSLYYNEEINSIFNEVKNTKNSDIIKEKYQRIYQIYMEEMPFVSLYFNRTTLCYSPNLMGDITPNCYNIFYNIENWYRQY